MNSDNREKAKKLLYAMTDVDDSYIEAAAHYGEGREKDRQHKVLMFRRWSGVIVAAAACAALVIVTSRLTGGLWRAGRSSGSSGSGSAAATAIATEATAAATEAAAEATANPYVEVSSLSEAEAITGFDMTVPEAEDPCSNTVVNVIDGSMIEVTYSSESGRSDSVAADSNSDSGSVSPESAQDTLNETETAADQTEDSWSIRKAEGTDDISGDYNEYADSETIQVNGSEVTLRGDDGKWSVATWTADGFTYAIEAQNHPFTEEEMRALVSAIR